MHDSKREREREREIVGCFVVTTDISQLQVKVMESAQMSIKMGMQCNLEEPQEGDF